MKAIIGYDRYTDVLLESILYILRDCEDSKKLWS
jgi:hypothetical protein